METARSRGNAASAYPAVRVLTRKAATKKSSRFGAKMDMPAILAIPPSARPFQEAEVLSVTKLLVTLARLLLIPVVHPETITSFSSKPPADSGVLFSFSRRNWKVSGQAGSISGFGQTGDGPGTPSPLCCHAPEGGARAAGNRRARLDFARAGG